LSSGEDDLIARYFKPLATDPGALGLTDDAALLKGGGDDLVVTTDAIVEGVHFLGNDPPDTVAKKALRVNLSDLAAKGATPAGFVLTLALRTADENWLALFARGLGDDAAAFACPLLGGDTVSTPGPQMISITAFGRVPKGRMVGRTGARPGDRILVTGTIGDAALGLGLLTGGEVAGALASDPAARDFLVSRYRVPQPRNSFAEAVRDHATAAMDVSDGLAGDLAKMMRAGGTSAVVDADKIPLSPAARAALAAEPSLFDRLVTGGDDYEILAAIPPERLDAFLAASTKAGVATTAIGTVTKGTALPLFRRAGEERRYERGSYRHF